MKIIVRTREGSEHAIEGKSGHSVMEVIRENLSESPFAICGGNCSCATCHIYVAAEFLERLPPMSDDENDILDGSNHRAARSRLSCQIPLTAELEGLQVEVAPEE